MNPFMVLQDPSYRYAPVVHLYLASEGAGITVTLREMTPDQFRAIADQLEQAQEKYAVVKDALEVAS